MDMVCEAQVSGRLVTCSFLSWIETLDEERMIWGQKVLVLALSSFNCSGTMTDLMWSAVWGQELVDPELFRRDIMGLRFGPTWTMRHIGTFEKLFLATGMIHATNASKNSIRLLESIDKSAFQSLDKKALKGLIEKDNVFFTLKALLEDNLS
jgi:hypothetical protein